MEQEEPPAHWLRKFISLGDILSLLIALVVFAYGYGSLNRDVDEIKRAVARDITPGADRRISVVEANDRQLEKEIGEIRAMQMMQRQEILTRLDRIEDLLTSHMNGSSKP